MIVSRKPKVKRKPRVIHKAKRGKPRVVHKAKRGASVRLVPRPWMSKVEIERLGALIRARKPRRVLEWGGGGSTIYWPPMFPDIDWWTVESDPRWAQAIRGRKPPNVTLLELQPPAYYELCPDEVGTFDLIIVDGISELRVKCLDVARRFMNPGGCAVLHDCVNPRHDPGQRYYHDVSYLCHPPKECKRGLMLFENPRTDV